MQGVVAHTRCEHSGSAGVAQKVLQCYVLHHRAKAVHHEFVRVRCGHVPTLQGTAIAIMVRVTSATEKISQERQFRM